MLVADDDAAVRRLVAAMLEGAGYRVATAADGVEALRLAEEQQPSVAVLDVRLPGLDGLEVARRIRASEAIANTPILLMSADAGGDAEAVMEAAPDAYLAKPFRFEELLAAVEALVQGSV